MFRMFRIRRLLMLALVACAVVAIGLTTGVIRTKVGQANFQFPGGFIRADVNGLLRQHVAGVERDGHANDGNAGSSIAMIDRPGHRGGAAIFWQERGVNVDSSLRRDRQHVAGKDLSNLEVKQKFFPKLFRLIVANIFQKSESVQSFPHPATF